MAGGGLALLERCDAGDFPASLYVEGPNEAVKAAFLAELRAAWAAHTPDAARPQLLRAPEAGVDGILTAWQSLSLFAARELIIVFEVEGLARSEKRVAALAAGLASARSASTLVLVESEADELRKSLEPLRAACGTRWLATPPGPGELLAWGARRLAREQIEAEAGALEAVLEACEGEALAFFSELSKLASFAAGGTLHTREVKELLSPVVGAELHEYVEAVALGMPGRAAQRLGRLLAAGMGEGQIVFALSNLISGALGGWSRHRELGIQLLRRRPRDLARAADAVYRAEAAWKGGRADVVAVLEQATRDVAR